MGGERRLFGEREQPWRLGRKGYCRGWQSQEDHDLLARVREILVFAGWVVMLRPPARIGATLPVPMGVAMLRQCLRMLMEQVHGTEP